MEIAWSYDNLSEKNIKEAFRRKDLPTNRWVLLYLYKHTETERDPVTQAFFIKYGAEICNWLGSGIPLYTVFSREIFESWQDKLEYGVFDAMKKQFEYAEAQTDQPSRYSVMKHLGDDYGIRSDEYPALVVIDANDNSQSTQTYAKKSLAGCSENTIYQETLGVIRLIRENPSDSKAVFEKFAPAVSKSATKVEKGILNAKFKTLKEVIDYFIHRYNVKQNDNYKLEHLFRMSNVPDYYNDPDERLTCSRSSFFKYMKEGSLPLKTAFEFAFIMKLNSHDFDFFIFYTKARAEELFNWKHRKDKRFSLIADCMDYNYSLTETNEELEENDFEPI